MILLSIIAVVDSIASDKCVQHIDSHLRAWLHHEAQNPVDGALNIQTIAAQV
jgi:hypothetical protein